MAYEISDLDGTVNAPDSDYLYGSLKNVPNGTRANVKMFTDLWETFQLLLAAGSIAPNGLPDNATNGHQLHQSLQVMVSQYIAPLIQSLIPNYDATKVYVLSGATTRGTDGYLFYDSEVYFFAGNTGAACFGTVDILVLQTTLSGNLRILKDLCGASGTGVSDYADIIFNPFAGSFTSITVFSGLFIAGTIQPGYAKGVGGASVYLRGNINSSSGSGVSGAMFTLPAGYRPTLNMKFVCSGVDGAAVDMVYHVTVATTGVVSTSTVIGAGATPELDLSNISFPTK